MMNQNTNENSREEKQVWVRPVLSRMDAGSAESRLLQSDDGSTPQAS
jgi:hypothetical protein